MNKYRKAWYIFAPVDVISPHQTARTLANGIIRALGKQTVASSGAQRSSAREASRIVPFADNTKTVLRDHTWVGTVCRSLLRYTWFVVSAYSGMPDRNRQSSKVRGMWDLRTRLPRNSWTDSGRGLKPIRGSSWTDG